MSGTNGYAGQSSSAIVGQATTISGRGVTASAAIVGQATTISGLGVTAWVTVVSQKPPLPPLTARERSFPLGYLNFPPGAGRPFQLNL